MMMISCITVPVCECCSQVVQDYLVEDCYVWLQFPVQYSSERQRSTVDNGPYATRIVVYC